MMNSRKSTRSNAGRRSTGPATAGDTDTVGKSSRRRSTDRTGTTAAPAAKRAKKQSTTTASPTQPKTPRQPRKIDEPANDQQEQHDEPADEDTIKETQPVPGAGNAAPGAPATPAAAALPSGAEAIAAVQAARAAHNTAAAEFESTLNTCTEILADVGAKLSWETPLAAPAEPRAVPTILNQILASPEYTAIAQQWEQATATLSAASTAMETAMRCGSRLLSAVHELRRAAQSLCAYADDFIWAASPLASEALHFLIYMEGEELGIPFDPEKDVAGRNVLVLGCEVNSHTLTMQLSRQRAALYHKFVADAVTQHRCDGHISTLLAEQLRGRLGFASQISRWASAFLGPLDADIGGATRAHATTVQLSHATLDDLTGFWLPVLHAPEGPWLRRHQWATLPLRDALARMDPRDISVATDASGSIGMGAVCTLGNLQRTYDAAESHEQIGFKETLAIKEVIAAYAAQGTTHRRIFARTDNVLAQRAINTASTRHQGTRRLIRELALICLTYDLDVRAEHVPGTFIKLLGADDCSRQFDATARALPSSSRLLALCGDMTNATIQDTSHFQKLLREQLDGERTKLFMSRIVHSVALGTNWTTTCAHCHLVVRRTTGLACRTCHRAVHRACLRHATHGATQWQCASCLRTEIPGIPADVDVSDIAALLASSSAAGTQRTYSNGVRQFLNTLSTHTGQRDVLPQSSDDAPTPLWALLKFLAIARDKTTWSRKYIANLLSAVRRWHLDLGFAEASLPTSHTRVKSAMRALGVSLATTSRAVSTPAAAVPASVVALLQAAAVQERDESTDPGARYAASRDALFLALAFLACLRKSEACQLRRSDVRIEPNYISVFIRKSKTDQDGVGHTLYLPHTSREEILLASVLRRHLAILDALGLTEPECPLFGRQRDPRTCIQGESILARLTTDSQLHTAYYTRLDRLGFALPRTLRRKTHGLRRGGICALRDHARSRGMGSYDLECILMVHGRWRDPRSVKQYLVQSIPTLVGLVAGIGRPPDLSDDNVDADKSTYVRAQEHAIAHAKVDITRAFHPELNLQ